MDMDMETGNIWWNKKNACRHFFKVSARFYNYGKTVEEQFLSTAMNTKSDITNKMPLYEL